MTLCIFFIYFSYSFFSFLWRRLSNTITPYISVKCDRILNIFYTNNYVLYLSEILLTIGMKKIVIRGKIKSLLFSCLLKQTSISLKEPLYHFWNDISFEIKLSRFEWKLWNLIMWGLFFVDFFLLEIMLSYSYLASMVPLMMRHSKLLNFSKKRNYLTSLQIPKAVC